MDRHEQNIKGIGGIFQMPFIMTPFDIKRKTPSFR
jgi:hypothetical protein